MKKILIFFACLLLLSGSGMAYLWAYGGAMSAACQRCQTQNRFDEKYCVQCGALTYALPPCPKCGAQNVIDDEYCVGCAAELPGKSFYLTLKNWFVQRRDSQRSGERQKITEEYRVRAEEEEIRKNGEIRKQKLIQANRDRQLKADDQQKQQQKSEQHEKERAERDEQWHQEQQQQQAEADRWKFSDWEKTPKQEGPS